MSNTPRLVSGYTLDALTSLTPPPVIAKRAPTAADTGYLVGTPWVYTTANQIYFLTSVANAAANWLLVETGGGAGSFSTLTSTGATTLATTGASVNTFGNTTGATSVGISVGTGGFTLTGAAASPITIGTGVTTGSISIGAAQTSGTLTIGGTGANTGTITIAGGTGSQIVNIANSTGGKTVNIGTGAGINDVIVGSTNTTSQTTIQAGSFGLILSAAGAVSVTPATATSATTTAVININVGVATYTGQTTAAAASIVLTVTNSIVTAGSAILVSVSTLGTNDAQLTVTRVKPAAGSFTVTCLNNGSASVNGNIILTFWVIAV